MYIITVSINIIYTIFILYQWETCVIVSQLAALIYEKEYGHMYSQRNKRPACTAVAVSGLEVG